MKTTSFSDVRHSWNWHLVKISDKGMAAFEQGKTRDDCPYPQARTGWNAQRRKAWLEGFELAVQIASDQRIFDKARAGVPGYIRKS